mgnify:CR=1 FL=1
MESDTENTQKADPVELWMLKEIAPAISECSTYLYEFSRQDLRDIHSSKEMLSKLILLNHKLGLLYADAVELKSEFETQSEEIYSKVLLMFSGKNPNTEARLTAETIKAAGQLATSDIVAFSKIFPSVSSKLNILPGLEPKRKINSLVSVADRLKMLQRDVQESINAIKHIGNRDLQHTIHGV